MPFEPWLKQPEPGESPESLCDAEDSRLLINILKTGPDEKPPPVDWFLDHLVPEQSEDEKPSEN